MATLTFQALQDTLTHLGVESGIPFCTAAHVLTRPVDLYKSCLAGILAGLVECDLNAAYSAIQPSPPNAIGNGDLTVTIPRLKLPDTDPAELAAELVHRFPPHKLFVIPFHDGVHIRVFFSSKTLPRLLTPYIHDRKAEYGKDASIGLRDPASPDSGRKKVIVEFSSPNVATDFTTAHLRSTILGAYIANIHQAMGWDVVRLNYLGDWGKNIGLLGLGWQRHGSGNEFEKDPLRHLHEIDARMEEAIRPEREAIKHGGKRPDSDPGNGELPLTAMRDVLFKNMEDGDQETIELCKKFREVTVSSLTKSYSRLGIRFDEYAGESRVKAETLEEVELTLRAKGVCKDEGEGATVIEFDQHGTKLGRGYVRKAGSTTYLLRDVAAVLDRFKTHSFDKMLLVVSGEQDTHFRQVFKALALMGRSDLVDRLQHISFGTVRGLSAQLGNAQLLDDILDECERQTRKALEADEDQSLEGYLGDSGNLLGISALLVQELALKNIQGANFESSQMTSVEEDTGISLQRCYAKLSSAIAAGRQGMTPEDISSIDYQAIGAEPWCNVLQLMARYPDMVANSYKTMEPGTLLSGLFLLVDEVTPCVDETLESTKEGSPSSSDTTQDRARVVFYEAVRQVLQNGMKILGIPIIAN